MNLPGIVVAPKTDDGLSGPNLIPSPVFESRKHRPGTPTVAWGVTLLGSVSSASTPWLKSLFPCFRQAPFGKVCDC